MARTKSKLDGNKGAIDENVSPLPELPGSTGTPAGPEPLPELPGSAGTPAAPEPGKYAKRGPDGKFIPTIPTPETEETKDFVSIGPGPGKRPKGMSKTNLWRKKQTGKEQSKQLTLITLAVLDGAGVMFFGPVASMNDIERDLIADPLERILSRLDLAAADTINKYADPILLIMGLSAWLSRVNRERKNPTAEPKPQIISKAPKPEGPQEGDINPPGPRAPDDTTLPIELTQLFNQGILSEGGITIE